MVWEESSPFPHNLSDMCLVWCRRPPKHLIWGLWGQSQLSTGCAIAHFRHKVYYSSTVQQYHQKLSNQHTHRGVEPHKITHRTRFGVQIKHSTIWSQSHRQDWGVFCSIPRLRCNDLRLGRLNWRQQVFINLYCFCILLFHRKKDCLRCLEPCNCLGQLVIVIKTLYLP